MSCIALLTDFGLQDPYVGQMKAVLDRKAPGVSVLDLCHGVRPGDVVQASFFLAASLPHFAQGSVLCCVVDPGVGTDRKVVLALSAGRYLLAPDNGLLGLALAWHGTQALFDVTPSRGEYEGSFTFHGRDLFAPLAANLSMGHEPTNLGRPVLVEELQPCPWAEPTGGEDHIRATVVSQDRFGNLALNLPERTCRPVLSSWETITLAHAPDKPSVLELSLVDTYGDASRGGPAVLAGSQGVLEIAVNRGSAAKELRLAPGDEAVLRRGVGMIFLDALSFLTRLAPQRSIAKEDLPRTVTWFPVVGLVLGALLALPLSLGLFEANPWAGAWLIAALSAWLTRGLHLDGLSDIADGIGSHFDPDRFWEIVKDSRVGSFGVLALILAVAGQVAFIQDLAASGRFGLVVWGFVLGRGAAGCLGWFGGRMARAGFSRPGLGSGFTRDMRGRDVLACLGLTLGLGLWLAPPASLALSLGLALAVLVFLHRLARRAGAVNGDFLGCAVVACELAGWAGGLV